MKAERKGEAPICSGFAVNAMGRRRMFWARFWLNGMGLAAACSAALWMFMALGMNTWFSFDTGKLDTVVQSAAFMFANYLMITGSVVVMMYTIALFQVYFSLFVSMNVTRKRAVGSILTYITLLIGGLLLLYLGILFLFLRDVKEIGLFLLPLYLALMAGGAAFCMAIGVVMIRWGKLGVLLLILLCALGGAAAGALFAMNGGEIFEQIVVNRAGDFEFRPVAEVCILLYLAAGIFAFAALRKAEVRR